jgi:hypothetical protein
MTVLHVSKLQATMSGFDGKDSPVFIAHAGEQKLTFADYVYVLLRRIHKLEVFLDEHSLEPGRYAPTVMKKKLEAAAVGKIAKSFASFCSKIYYVAG